MTRRYNDRCERDLQAAMPSPGRRAVHVSMEESMGWADLWQGLLRALRAARRRRAAVPVRKR